MTEHREHSAELGDRLAAGLLYRAQRLAGAAMVTVENVLRRPRLHDHQADPDGDHVVDPARDPRAPLFDGGPRNGVAFPPELKPAIPHPGRPRTPAPNPTPGH